MRKVVPKLFFCLGIICLIFTAGLIWQRNNPQRLAFASQPLRAVTQSTNQPHQPTEIIISDLNIDLPIIPTKSDGKNWPTTSQGVSFLASSVIPGEKGNSIFYGHNWQNLLGNLTKAKPGQTIKIKFADGTKKEFGIIYTITVSPDNSSILNQSNDNRITIYTCTGFFDSKRFVVVATLI